MTPTGCVETVLRLCRPLEGVEDRCESRSCFAAQNLSKSIKRTHLFFVLAHASSTHPRPTAILFSDPQSSHTSWRCTAHPPPNRRTMMTITVWMTVSTTWRLKNWRTRFSDRAISVPLSYLIKVCTSMLRRMSQNAGLS